MVRPAPASAATPSSARAAACTRRTRWPKGEWLTTAPEDHPFSAGQIPAGHVHHFLLPADGWGAVAGEKEAKQLAPDQAEAARHVAQAAPQGTVGRRRAAATSSPRSSACRPCPVRAEYLWALVIERLQHLRTRDQPPHRRLGRGRPATAVEAIPRDKILADLTTPGTPYWRLKTVMDAWCALWFWPLDKAALLDGSDAVYKTTPQPVTPAPEPAPVDPDPAFPTVVGDGFPVRRHPEAAHPRRSGPPQAPPASPPPSTTAPSPWRTSTTGSTSPRPC